MIDVTSDINQLVNDMWNCIDSECVMPESLAQAIDEKLSDLVEIIEDQAEHLGYLNQFKSRTVRRFGEW